MTSFAQRFVKALDEKKSYLCVGLDPAVAGQREHDVIPTEHPPDQDARRIRLEFCLDMLEKTGDVAIAAKPNEQYVFGFTLEDHQTLTKVAHSKGLVCILDCKLGDIGDTAQSKLYWVHRAGYDAITVHTQQGNLRHMVSDAHGKHPQLGIFALVLMSNPEAVRYFKRAIHDGEPLYLSIARDVRECSADGCVVGATGHVTEQEIAVIANIVGQETVFLVPGLGAQKGEPNKVFRAGITKVLFNVGRDIMYSPDPQRKARDYAELLNNLAKKYRR